MTTTAVVVSWNCVGVLMRCLGSLREAGCPVVLVDNASTDGTVARVREEYPEVVVLAQTWNAGFAAGMNVGIRAALMGEGGLPVPESVLFLNPDAELLPGALSRLQARLEEDAGLGAVAPAIVNADGTPQAYAFGSDPTLRYLLRRGWNRVFRGRALHDWGEKEESSPDWLTGACMLARAEVFTRDALLWGEGYFLYFEDNDWCLQLREHGWRLLRDPAVQCRHEGGASVRANPAARRAYRKGLKRFYEMHYPAWQGWILRLLLPVYASVVGR